MTKSLESKMLDQVRRWRKKAYEADRMKTLSQQAKEHEKLAREFGLPLVQMHKSDSRHRR